MKKLALIIPLVVLGGVVAWRLRFSEPAGSADVPVATPVKRTEPAPSALPPPQPVAPAPVATATPTPAPAPRRITPTAADLVALRKATNEKLLREFLQPGNGIYDASFGLMATYPADWTVRDAALRWGVNEGENTIFFGPPEGSRANPSMYYRRYSDGPRFDMGNPEATLRDMARQKEESRSDGGANDYRNDPDSFVFRTIDGHPSLSYFATWTRNGEVHAEYFLRILGPTGYVMFFNQGSAKDVQALIPTIVGMAGTVKPP